MRSFNFVNSEIKDINSVKAALLASTIEICIYNLYLTQPLANAESINQALSQYARTVSSLTSRVEDNWESSDEQDLAGKLRSFKKFLIPIRVDEPQFLEQRDAISEEIFRKVDPILKGVRHPKYDPEFLKRYLSLAREEYYAKRKEMIRRLGANQI